MNFRDRSLVSLLVGYDWSTDQHFVDITVVSANESPLTYRITRLSAWSVFEDFQAQHIGECTLLHDQPGIYLSLDPFQEGQRNSEDNQWFVGDAIVPVSRSNNSLERTREG